MPYFEAGVGIGFPFYPDKTLKKFKKKLPEKSHEEERWDPKTGEEVGLEQVVDEEEREVIEFDGKTFELNERFFPEEEVLEYIAKKAGGIYARSGACNTNGEIDPAYTTHSFDIVGYKDDLGWILKNAKKKCDKLHKKLTAMGIKGLFKPCIIASASEA